MFALVCLTAGAQEIKKTNDKTGLYTQDKFGGTNVNFGIGTNHPNYRFELFGTANMHSNVMVDSTLMLGPIKLNGLNGEFHNTQWAGINKRLMMTDEDGKLFPILMGASDQVLFGDGVWRNIPSQQGAWSSNGNSVYYNNGNVGIGTQYPVYSLDVYGDIRATNNLYVGGGIVISEKMQANSDVKTRTLDADSIKMGPGKIIVGETEVSGDVKLKYKLDVIGDATFRGDHYLDGSQYLQGNQEVNGNLTARQGFTFDGFSGFRHFAQSGNLSEVYTLGASNLRPTDISTNACISPTQDPWFYFGGRIQLFNQASNTALTMGSDNVQSSIDASGNNGLLINYYCGKDVAICTGANGGNITLGKRVGMQHAVGIGYNSTGNVDDNVALNVFANDVNQTALKLNVYEGTVKAIDLVNPGNNFSAYTVAQNGKTQIKGTSGSAFEIYNPGMNNTLSFQVDGNGKMQIKGASNEALQVYNPVDNSLSFEIDADGDMTSAKLAGQGTRSLLVDANGKLVAGTVSSTTAVAWELGGNSISVPANSSSETFGTNTASDLIFKTANSPKMVITADGKFGMGTTTPFEFLQLGDRLTIHNGGTKYIGYNSYYDGSTGTNKRFANDYASSIAMANGEISFNVASSDIIGSEISFIKALRIASDGRVHIGDRIPTTLNVCPDAKLSIDGKMIAYQGIYVNVLNWADYVFNSDYKLPNLYEIEKYYIANKHLPEIPSETEVKANGLELGEMNALLLKKIEELTILMVEQQRQIDELKGKLKSDK